MFDRIFGNLKTTIGGTSLGAGLTAAMYLVLDQAHCDFSQVQWVMVLGAVFSGPTIVGGLSTDNGKTVGYVQPS